MIGRGTAARVLPEDIELRPLGPGDVTERYVSWLNDPEVSSFLEVRHSQPVSRQDVVDFVAHCEAIRRHHWGVFVQGEHVGNISCGAYSRVYRWVNVSNVIGDPRYRQSNVAKLALAAALEYFFTVADFHKVCAGVYAVNLPGIVLLSNLGFVKEAVLRDQAMHGGQFVDVLQFGILESEWAARRGFYPAIRVVPPAWEHGPTPSTGKQGAA